MRELDRLRKMVAAAVSELPSPAGDGAERAVQQLVRAVQRASALTGAMREGAIPVTPADRERAAAAWRKLGVEARRAGLLVAQMREFASERLGQCGYAADGAAESGRMAARWSVRA